MEKKPYIAKKMEKDGKQLLVLLFMEERMNRNEGGNCPLKMGSLKATWTEKLNWKGTESLSPKVKKAKHLLGWRCGAFVFTRHTDSPVYLAGRGGVMESQKQEVKEFV